MYDKDIFEVLHTRTKLPMREITPHDINKEIYADVPIQDLKDSIEEHGMYEPLKVVKTTNGYLLVSGHRRLKALKEIFGKEADDCLVPVDILPLPNTIFGIAELIIENNRYRQKSNIELLKEGEILEEVYAEKAGQRMISGQKSEGTTRDAVGEKLGISGRTYAEGKKALAKAKELEKTDPDKASEIKDRLKKSIHGAARSLKEEEKPAESKYDYWPELRGLIKVLYRKHEALKRFRNHKTSNEFSNLVGNILDFAELLETWNPVNVEEKGPGWNKKTNY